MTVPQPNDTWEFIPILDEYPGKGVMKKEEQEPQAEPIEPADDSTPSKQKSNQFTLSDKEVEANEKGAAYPNDGPFGIGQINRK